jgi:hypothetical protein
MGMTVLYFDLREQDCYRFGPVCQETFSGYCVMCGTLQAVAPTDAQQVFIRMPGRPLTANRKGLLYQVKT